ncbi:T-lymphocyte surface antigen Ly-9-like [Notothenia coriiceps]|uniref:T-lymphocyte surface antigen Ly-9-like n=1 Tax=Notothenia coriiceps TaxID=8208 RepID=A0A6I9NJ59_9TELE|nr:PREDICTED: T-lymphocyte surface antigen Ly-9-like [Notothenia coriiceps]
MACLAATLGLVLFSGIMDLSAANKDPCDLYALVGQNLTLPFVFEGLGVHELRWTHNTKIIFHGQQSRVSHGKAEDISKTGSLFLKNLQFSSAGIYRADVVNPNRTLAKTWHGSLCVMDKVSKPQLTYICDKSSAVILNCNVANPQGLTFSWTVFMDDKTLSETKQTLSISLAQQKVVRSFTCSVANKVSEEKSDTVRPYCESPPPPSLFGLKSQILVLAVLAGGPGLILLLLVIIITLCCRYRRIKTQMRRRDQEGLRMPSLNKLESNFSSVYETMHQTEDAPTVSQTSLPKYCCENVTQPEARTENKPAQLSADAEGQKPSPVPKPRTKGPKAPNI